MTRHTSLAIYFGLLVVLCTAFVVGAKMLGQQGVYLAQGYMLTPAIAALITRRFFYAPGFKDANLRLGRVKDYLRFWLLSLAITAVSYVMFTLLGAVTWDFTGQAFLERLAQQFAAVGQDINDTLPPGFTPRTMLLIYFVGGLTVFNILPGIISGFGEEFGHRGFMLPLLYRIKPWVGIVVGGLIWYAWHLPLALVVPTAASYPLWQTVLQFVVLAIGSICTFIYLGYVYARSESVWVTAVAHIALNNAAQSFSYFAVLKNQVLANTGLTLTMILVVVVLYYTRELQVLTTYFAPRGEPQGG